MSYRDWHERIKVGVSAVSGILMVFLSFYAGLGFLWLAMKAPEFCAIVIAAALVASAIHFRRPTRIYNIQMPHPEADEMMEVLHALLNEKKERT